LKWNRDRIFIYNQEAVIGEKVNDESAGKQKRIPGATKPHRVFLHLPNLWEMAVHRQ